MKIGPAVFCFAALLAVAPLAWGGDRPITVNVERFRPEMGAALSAHCKLGRALCDSWARSFDGRNPSGAEYHLAMEGLFSIAMELEMAIKGARSLLPARFHSASARPLNALLDLYHDYASRKPEAPGAAAALLRQAIGELDAMREAVAELGSQMRR